MPNHDQLHRTCHWRNAQGRSWVQNNDDRNAIRELRGHRKFNRFWGHVTLATLNVRSLGRKRQDADFYYSYLQSLSHDALGLTEMWNSQRHYESWACVTSVTSQGGVDRPAGVCILLSRRFASRQLHRGKIGTRGCWVRIQGPTCNLLIICIYVPPIGSKAEVVGLMKGLREVLLHRSQHDCVILLGDLNVEFPRRYRKIIGPYAWKQGQTKLRRRTREFLEMFEQHSLCVPSTYFRPKRRHSMHTWRGAGPNGSERRGQIDHIVASKRWRSCFHDCKVYWNAQRFKSGTKTDHGMLVSKFRWRLCKQKRAPLAINWTALKPLKADDDDETNPVLDTFEDHCKRIWETQLARLTGARPQGDSGNEEQRLQSAAETTLQLIADTVTEPSSVGVGDGTVVGVSNSLIRGVGDSSSTDLGRIGQRDSASQSSLKAATSQVTSPSLEQVGTGTRTGVVNGLDCVLSDGEDNEEGSRRRVHSAAPISTNRTAFLGGTPSAEASAVAAASSPVGNDAATATTRAASVVEGLSSSDYLTCMNEVCVRAARMTIPTVPIVRPGRMRPSLQSRQFAEERARKLAAGVTPRERKELHRKMGRLRRKDYLQWHRDCINQLNQCVIDGRWRDVRKWKDVLRGVNRQARVLPSRCYQHGGVIRSDAEAAHQFKRYMLDLFARRLSDRARYGNDWPDLEGDPDGPGSEWNDTHFNLAMKKVRTGKAPGLNGVKAELYKYSHWAREKLRGLLRQVWKTAVFPPDMLTGVATASFKSGNAQLWSRYRVIVVFRVEFKIFSLVLHFRIISECRKFLSDWMFAFLRGRSTADVHYIARQLYRAICLRGQQAAAVHVDYSSAFDSLSHIYVFNALKAAGASCKTRQIFKAIYLNARVVAKVGASLSEPFSVGRGCLEGDINSPIFFNIGLEAVFREYNALRESLALSSGIKLRDVAYDKVVFADDVTMTGDKGMADLSHRIQLLQFSSSKAGLVTSAAKSCTQHIGHSSNAPAVTPRDVEALKPKYECPKAWCTRRFTSATEVRFHVLWHDRREGVGIDQDNLAKGQIIAARGPPEHRYYLVLWATGESKWLLHKGFGPKTQHLIDIFFIIHFHLDRGGDISVPGEQRCVQCNMFFTSAVELVQHVRATHTFPAMRGTIIYHKARKQVMQRFQEGLPSVELRGGVLKNKFVKKWVGMTYDADGGQEYHVRERLMWSGIEFGRQRTMLRNRRLNLSIKISGYKGAVLVNATYGCESIRLTASIKRKYQDFNARCLSVISGRTFAAEKQKPTFDVIAWIHWRRARWLGKALRGEKGTYLLNAVRWGFQRQQRGDIFDDLPPEMKTSFNTLQTAACNAKAWSDYCEELRPEKWVRYDDNGNANRRRSPRQANRARERSFARESLRRQLVGTTLTRRPAPDDVPTGEIHVYTDGSASLCRGRWGAGCGVWFGDQSDFNISAIPPGRQTNNRAELVAIVLAIRKAMTLPTEFNSLVIFSDSRLCVDGISKWLPLWEADGWTRNGQRLENVDLWKVIRRVLSTLDQKGISFTIKHVPAHAGVYGNERADRLAKAAARRAHQAHARTAEQREEQAINALADSIVDAILAR